jgi:hypothetical protein
MQTKAVRRARQSKHSETCLIFQWGTNYEAIVNLNEYVAARALSESRTGANRPEPGPLRCKRPARCPAGH